MPWRCLAQRRPWRRSVSALIDAIVSDAHDRGFKTARPIDKVLNDATIWAAFPLVGGLLAHRARPRRPGCRNAAWRSAAVLVLVFMATNFLNFALVDPVLTA